MNPIPVAAYLKGHGLKELVALRGAVAHSLGRDQSDRRGRLSTPGPQSTLSRRRLTGTNYVTAAARIDRVIARRARDDSIPATLTEQPITAAAACSEAVASASPDQQIPAHAAAQAVTSVASKQPVLTGEPAYSVVPASAQETVVRGTASDPVGPRTGIDAILPGSAIDRVISSQAEDLVAGSGGVDRVRLVGADAPIGAAARKQFRRRVPDLVFPRVRLLSVRSVPGRWRHACRGQERSAQKHGLRAASGRS